MHTRRALMDGVTQSELLQALGTPRRPAGRRLSSSERGSWPEEFAAYEGPGTVASGAALTDAARLERNKET
ncbi:hypothetical protein [Streptomyces sp. NPDC055105]|uniref:hypothetical protein n=1 Tax=Streptomyces sp. NPDC055105 TaxID=3365719 RepID=UPI0037CDC76C